jgi:teichuronic acid biosynthesis glycosyltransferase TuaC
VRADMKIAVITQIFPIREQPYRGHSVYETVVRTQQFAEVKVFSPHPTYVTPIRARTRSWQRPDLSYDPGGVPTQYVQYPAVAGLSRPANGWVCGRRLEPLVRAYGPDVILSYWIYPDGFAATYLARKFSIPAVVKTIGTDLNVSGDPISSYLARQVLSRADLVLTVSDELRAKVMGRGIREDKVRTIHNGCDSTVFHPGEPPEARRELGLDDKGQIILYVGRLDLAKGLIELLKATASANAQFPDLQLFLVGDGSAHGALEKASAELGISERVRFVGAQPSAKVATWMRASDLLALPSYREGCPNVVLEALSCGLPVVATHVGGIPEVVTSQCSVLIPPRDHAALAQAIASALSRFWDRQQIARSMQRSWETVAQETYQACVDAIALRSDTMRRTVDAPR